MRLIFHGILRKLYGESVEMHATTVREAIEGFSRQQEDWPKDTRIVVPGHLTLESLDSRADEIHLMPSLCGGSGNWTNILIGAALIGASFIPGVGAALAASMIISGGLMMLQGVMGMFMKAPSYKKNQDPEASKYLAVNKNTTVVGTPITLAYGTVELAGHWLSLQSDSNNLSHGVFPTTP